ncbi:MAG TPA: YbjN domain-containing protein [Alphaproteobacteria bacterium]|jgi:hypothetical protein|nr:YbjN domain-containing protein [Alphaproteobacteria bacterium]
MAEAILMTMSPEQIGDILKGAGYRAEHRTDASGLPLIASATSGINFNIRMGNRANAPAEGFIDFTYLTIIKINGEFPIDKVNEWNRNRRFSRLHKVDDFIVLDMDVIVAGGITEQHFRATMELWERMLQELMAWLRGDAPANAA